VRIEEMLNYFDYDYAPPRGDHPIAVHADVAAAPWNSAHRVVRIGIQAAAGSESARNLVLVVDVSGSMDDPQRLPLLKRALKLLTGKLAARDRIALVAYSTNPRVVLEATRGSNRGKIHRAINGLKADGSTNGSDALRLAYDIARKNLKEGANNRVILFTDGEFNAGITGDAALAEMIRRERSSGVFLSVLGFGDGSGDRTLETLADHGNGNYAYIDSFNEAYKVLSHQMDATLVNVAKDVKIQVELNPARAEAYRLIGYENRRLAAADFRNDYADGGELGGGDSFTAIYEVIPMGGGQRLKYQARPEAASKELLTVNVRYKRPNAATSQGFDVPLVDSGQHIETRSADFRFAVAVAQFGMRLRGDASTAGGDAYERILSLAKPGLAKDPHKYRKQFVDLVQLARRRGL
jgi:Ca-activated chloride channel family protein